MEKGQLADVSIQLSATYPTQTKVILFKGSVAKFRHQKAVTFVRGSEVYVNRPPDSVAPALLVTHVKLDCQQTIKMNARCAPHSGRVFVECPKLGRTIHSA
ncbi:hypothetical protein AJ87_05935 [Rhizobium yanglingense]|nr:hypothetical protein AJ87_05935 [Rhizobium yanglingense]